MGRTGISGIDLDLAPELDRARRADLGRWPEVAPGTASGGVPPALQNDLQGSQLMITASDIRKLTSLSGDARQTVTTAFEALEQWRDEIFSVNERHSTKVLDQVASLQRAMDWPDQFTATSREHLTKASKAETYMIDQVMDAWEYQLKSANIPSGLPESCKFQTPPLFGSAFMDPASEVMRLQELTLAPFKLWIQTAEMWQRSWTGIMSGPAESRPSRPVKRH
jgi:hypothetical protein